MNKYATVMKQALVAFGNRYFVSKYPDPKHRWHAVWSFERFMWSQNFTSEYPDGSRSHGRM